MLGFLAGAILMTIVRSQRGSEIEPTPRIGIRVFKQEAILEVWGCSSEEVPFKIAKMSGSPGPKRRERDLQVPEGFYHINRYNPKSRFHLSLGLNYPNESDLVLGDHQAPGSDIFIHGSNVSVGCMAMTDPVIDVIYPLAVYARDKGQVQIPVQIFPCKMTSANMARLKDEFAEQPELIAFWENLEPDYNFFEAKKVWPEPSVAKDGSYVWEPRGAH